jgi:hypothetical protein
MQNTWPHRVLVAAAFNRFFQDEELFTHPLVLATQVKPSLLGLVKD